LHRLLFFLLIVSLPLGAQSFEELMQQGREAMMQQEYDQAKSYFEQAVELQPENSLPLNYLKMIEKLRDIERQDNAQEVENFMEQKEQHGDPQDDVAELNPDIQEDFIYQQEQKEIARKERPLFSLHLAMPISLSGSWLLGNQNQWADTRGWLYQGYHIEGLYFPDFLSRQLGFGVELHKALIPQDEQPIGLNNLYLQIQLRNYLAEQPGIRMILGTKVGFGLTMLEDRTPDQLEMIPSWSFGVFFSDSLFYRLSGFEALRPLRLKAQALVRYGENLQNIEGQGSLVYQMERVDIGLIWDFGYPIILSGTEYYPWSVSLAIGKNF
jgi:hypothetical protein